MTVTPRTQLVSAAFALVALLRLPSFLTQLFDPDEASIASQAITLQHGGTLYIDSIDRKPPMVPEIYRASFDLFGTSLIPLHVFVAVLLAFGAAAVALEMLRTHGRTAAWWGLFLYIGGALAFLPDSGQAANYAHFALFPGTLAVIWARRGGWRWAVLGGIALGVAVLCRQTWAIGLLPGAMALWWPNRTWRTFWQGTTFVVVTVLTTASAALVYSADGFWHWAFASNEGFVASFGTPGMVLPSFLGQTSTFLGFHAALVVLLIIRCCRAEIRQRLNADVDLWLWGATGVVAAFTGFRFFGHYFLQVLPGPVLLAAPVAAMLASKVRLRAVVAGLLATAALVAFVFAWMPRTLRHLNDPTRIAAYVDQHTTSDQAIFVWGNFPEIYWRADRPTSGSFVSTDFVVGLSGNRAANPSTLKDSTPGSIEMLLASLKRNPPTLVLDTATAGIHQYDQYPMSVIPELDRWIRAHYDVAGSVDGVRIYRWR